MTCKEIFEDYLKCGGEKMDKIENKIESIVTSEQRKRVSLKQNAKGAIQFELTVEDYSKSNDEIVKEVNDLKEKVLNIIK